MKAEGALRPEQCKERFDGKIQSDGQSKERFDGKIPTEHLRRLWIRAFGEPDFWDSFFGTAFRADHTCCIEEEKRVAAALYWFDCVCRGQKIAYIFAVATDPDCRHRGLCRRLMQESHSRLRQQGYDAAMLVPAEEGLVRMYENMGYRPCTSVREFTCRAGDDIVSLEKISGEEFILRRRELLPAGSVLQEGETIDLLQTMAEFYAGEELLLTAWKEGDSLTVPEYLGDPGLAPAVVRALGCRQGSFRMPGETPGTVAPVVRRGQTSGERGCEKKEGGLEGFSLTEESYLSVRPFAMWYPLTEEAQKPVYFAFAFD